MMGAIGTAGEGGASTPGWGRLGIASLAGLCMGIGLGGCEMDGFLGDPRASGRWEPTPIVVPILEKIDVIESDTGEFVEVTEVRGEDLIPVIDDYKVNPGDVVRVTIFDLDVTGQPSTYEAAVDATGAITVPQLGRVMIEDLTGPGIERAIADRLVELQLTRYPEVTAQVLGRRQESYSIFGAVPGPSRYQIPYPDYRLLEALTDAGGIQPIIKYVYVIRQVPLSDEVDRGIRNIVDEPGRGRPAPPQGKETAPKPGEGEELLEIIDDLTSPEGNPGGFSMSSMGSNWEGGDFQGSSLPAVDLDDDGSQAGQPPAVDLIEEVPSGSARPIGPVGATPMELEGAAHWLFIDGEWVQVIRRQAAEESGLPEGDDPLGSSASGSDLVTQRVIKVPTAPLLQGVASYNIVIRPQDVISVPGPTQGVVYVGGPGITVPGVYPLPVTGPLTIQRAVIAAGGLSPVANATRVDITRMVGGNKQATLRVSYSDIANGLAPDILLKPDDIVNFGTDFWQTPLAIVRGGFRTSYGFGFLLDRNFGNDVFGAPPSNNNN